MGQEAACFTDIVCVDVGGVELASRQTSFHDHSKHNPPPKPNRIQPDASQNKGVSSKTTLASFVAEASVHDAPSRIAGHAEPSVEPEATAQKHMDVGRESIHLQAGHQRQEPETILSRDDDVDDENRQLLSSSKQSDNIKAGTASSSKQHAQGRPWYTRKQVVLTLAGYGMVSLSHLHSMPSASLPALHFMISMHRSYTLMCPGCACLSLLTAGP